MNLNFVFPPNFSQTGPESPFDLKTRSEENDELLKNSGKVVDGKKKIIVALNEEIHDIITKNEICRKTVLQYLGKYVTVDTNNTLYDERNNIKGYQKEEINKKQDVFIANVTIIFAEDSVLLKNIHNKYLVAYDEIAIFIEEGESNSSDVNIYVKYGKGINPKDLSSVKSDLFPSFFKMNKKDFTAALIRFNNSKSYNYEEFLMDFCKFATIIPYKTGKLLIEISSVISQIKITDEFIANIEKNEIFNEVINLFESSLDLVIDSITNIGSNSFVNSNLPLLSNLVNGVLNTLKFIKSSLRTFGQNYLAFICGIYNGLISIVTDLLADIGQLLTLFNRELFQKYLITTFDELGEYWTNQISQKWENFSGKFKEFFDNFNLSDFFEKIVGFFENLPSVILFSFIGEFVVTILEIFIPGLGEEAIFSKLKQWGERIIHLGDRFIDFSESVLTVTQKFDFSPRGALALANGDTYRPNILEEIKDIRLSFFEEVSQDYKKRAKIHKGFNTELKNKYDFVSDGRGSKFVNKYNSELEKLKEEVDLDIKDNFDEYRKKSKSKLSDEVYKERLKIILLNKKKGEMLENAFRSQFYKKIANIQKIALDRNLDITYFRFPDFLLKNGEIIEIKSGGLTRLTKTMKQLEPDLIALKNKQRYGGLELKSVVWYVNGEISERVLDGISELLKKHNIPINYFKLQLTND